MNAHPGAELAEALRVMKQHEGYGCPECTPAGCPAEQSAVLTVFAAVAARAGLGRKSMDELRAIANEMRGLTPQDREGEQRGCAPGNGWPEEDGVRRVGGDGTEVADGGADARPGPGHVPGLPVAPRPTTLGP